jgi:hypothetical protein
MLLPGRIFHLAAFVLSNFNPVSAADTSGCPFEGAEKLRAQAARYRMLAETLFDPNMMAVVQQCARELEAEAKALEQLKSGNAMK